ncbi:hypothetical protein CYD53_103409 [Bosea psychrotolerans]|uniref:Uncharacterized protein n=1 Tax=Bosea psychrotolerans TaxID=1871628 RepID=A0A2S4MI49_9HYPH|nr:hypothetical protein CYD53_103409 [Bosea psychrotolerans]
MRFFIEALVSEAYPGTLIGSGFRALRYAKPRNDGSDVMNDSGYRAAFAARQIVHCRRQAGSAMIVR